jgi:hypothetical protein
MFRIIPGPAGQESHANNSCRSVYETADLESSEFRRVLQPGCVVLSQLHIVLRHAMCCFSFLFLGILDCNDGRIKR